MWTTSSLPLLSYQQHQPSQPPCSVSNTFSFLSPSSSSGLATRHSHRLQLEIVDRHQSDSSPVCYDRSCYSTSSRRRILLFMSSISFLLPQHSLAEPLDAAKLLAIQTSLRAVLSKPKAAGMLRMTFHDAGTYDAEDHSGGMNGSILYELDRPENTGLNKSLKILEKAKREVDKIHQVSWADFIAVAGAEAVFLCGGPAIPVKVGRLDVRKPDPVGKLPKETLDASGLKSCFQRKGFSTQELVALSGAHTLGSKGFGNPNVFDNAYYKILLERPWTSSEEIHYVVDQVERSSGGSQPKISGDAVARSRHGLVWTQVNHGKANPAPSHVVDVDKECFLKSWRKSVSLLYIGGIFDVEIVSSDVAHLRFDGHAAKVATDERNWRR